MRRKGHTLAHVPAGHNIAINRWSMQAMGLVSLWSFRASGHMGTMVQDVLRSNNGTVAGTYNWQEQDVPLGSGVSMGTANDSYIDCGNDASLAPAPPGLTVTAWVRVYNSFRAFEGIIGKGDADSSTLGSYLMYVTTGNHLAWLDYSGSARKDSLTGAATLATQGMYFLAATWNPSTRASIFVNGIRDATTTTSVPATLDNPNYNFLIGSNQGGATKSKYNFNGMFFEVRLYNTFKTEDEIWQMWNPPTRWDLYRSPTRFISFATQPAPTGRVFGPAAQIF